MLPKVAAPLTDPPAVPWLAMVTVPPLAVAVVASSRTTAVSITPAWAEASESSAMAAMASGGTDRCLLMVFFMVLVELDDWMAC